MSAQAPPITNANVPYRLPATAILRAFLSVSRPADTALSGMPLRKRHLVITGSIHSGKSTLLKELITLLSLAQGQDTVSSFPTLRSFVRRDAQPQVFLEFKNQRSVIGTFIPERGRMEIVEEGFLEPGLQTLAYMQASTAPYCVIDELGFLETACLPFQEAVTSLLDTKNCLLVLRKQDTPFLNALRRRPDAFVYDLDAPLPEIGVIIMASGEGKRFGSNKLLHPFRGRPLIAGILEATRLPFLKRIVVTRHKDIEALCVREGIPVYLHDRPYRNHTVMLGTAYLQKEHAQLAGYMYASSDQPLMSRDTLTALSLILQAFPSAIVRPAWCDTPGNPILFDACYYDELMTLPDQKGGSFIAKKYPEKNIFLPVTDRKELIDIDTPEDLKALL